MGDYSTRNSDEFCKRLLTKGKPQELKDWLRIKTHTLGELPSHEQSVQLAGEIYAAGAVHAFGVEIDKYPEGENTGKLVIELPVDPGSRTKILDWAAKIAHEQGFDAESEVGQKYVFVMLD